ncbi:MAG: alpha/beta fold hydrolase [Elusimicrobiota bacterium]|nr:alpha/beta fold hydrolase [Elusimicrobiota bacterium]
MKLSVAQWGDPDGLPVVLLHAFPMSGAMWEPQRQALAAYRVLVPDLRGFGATPLVGPWLIEHAAADVLESVPEKCVFVGLSMGGYVALKIAETAPERVRALVLCDTRAEADANENKLKRAAAIDFVRKNGVDAFLGPFLKDAVHDAAALGFLRGVAAKSSPEAVMAALAALAARPDALPGLSRVVAPTAFLVGSQDKITPLPLSETMRARIPGAELHLVPDAGHFSNAENPAVFNERLLSFLRRL